MIFLVKKVELSRKYSFDIVLKGDLKIGSMGMSRLGLELVNNEYNHGN